MIRPQITKANNKKKFLTNLKIGDRVVMESGMHGRINHINKKDNSYPKPKQIGANISNNHFKYALTWFSLAVSIFLIYLYFRKKNY